MLALTSDMQHKICPIFLSFRLFIKRARKVPHSVLNKHFSSFFSYTLHCNENPIYVFPEKELRGLSPNFHIRVCEQLIYFQDRSTYFPAAE